MESVYTYMAEVSLGTGPAVKAVASARLTVYAARDEPAFADTVAAGNGPR
jgi:hypothetical protein